jgi:peptide deformylase
MVLEVVKYGHPILRQRGERVEAVTPDIQKLGADLLETMHAAHGIGLAAHQVGRPLQMMAVDVREATDRPSTLQLEGKPASVEAFMPLLLINPAVTPAAPPAAGPEGCLSFPEMFADIVRPESVDVTALDLHGQPLAFRCGGLLARAIQHELDHLKGILFIDRMTSEKRRELQPELDQLQAQTKAALKRKTP